MKNPVFVKLHKKFGQYHEDNYANLPYSDELHKYLNLYYNVKLPQQKLQELFTFSVRYFYPFWYDINDDTFYDYCKLKIEKRKMPRHFPLYANKNMFGILVNLERIADQDKVKADEILTQF